jgi:hypothetical protein
LQISSETWSEDFSLKPIDPPCIFFYRSHAPLPYLTYSHLNFHQRIFDLVAGVHDPGLAGVVHVWIPSKLSSSNRPVPLQEPEHALPHRAYRAQLLA